MREINIFVFGDKFYSKLISCIRVEVHSLVCIYTRTRVGVRATQSLPLDCEKARNVQCYSSNPGIVFPAQAGVQRLIPATVNTVMINVRTMTADYR